MAREGLVGFSVYDMHCHVGFCDDPAAFALGAQRCGVGLLSCAVQPCDLPALEHALGAAPNVALAAGFHPWWVQASESGALAPGSARALEQLEAQIFDTRFVAEVGLDFSARFEEAHDAQCTVFKHAACSCSKAGDRVLSIHAVRSATAVLDVLEQAKCLPGDAGCVPILHWFSGTDAELNRAIALGCCFSVGERMLSTRRGQAYVAKIPLDRLLLETDLPPQDAPGFEFADLHESLQRAARIVADLRGPEALPAINVNSRRLLGF